jgi:dsDNA-specific endonuclease/ATPase MutS2
MRSVDLALYADELASRAATLAAELERARCRLRREAIEREARRALDEGSVARLDAVGIFHRGGTGALRSDLRELSASLTALEELQAWVEARLAAAQEELSAA